MAKRKTKLNSLRDARLGGLRVLFREVLQQIPPEDADKLRTGYLDKKQIVFVLRESKSGAHCKTAFSYCLAEDVKVVSPVLDVQGGTLLN